MEIEKTFRVAAPQAEVWDFVTSAEKVASCMPGVEDITVVAPGKYKGVMTVKVGPIKTSIKADVEEVEQRPPEYAAYAIKGEEGGRASRMNSETSLSLSPLSETETEVRFTSQVKIIGRLGKFAGGVMKKLADAMSEDFIVAFRQQLEGEPEPVAAEAQAPSPGLWTGIKAFFARLLGRS